VRYDADAWRALPFVETLGPEQTRDIFTEWPWSRASTLEVRRCTCGRTVTSLESATSVASHAA
jgi:hypothetical protein